jgi:maleate isomerase
MYGWRAKLGILIPSTDTTTEPEFGMLAPKGVTFHAARMLISSITVEGITAMEEYAIRAAKEVASAGVDLIGFCCTAGTFIKGKNFDVRLKKRIEEETDVPTITTSGAVIDSLNILNICKVAMITPYDEKLNELEKKFLESHGKIVTEIMGLGLTTLSPHFPLAKSPVSPIGLLEPYYAYKMARGIDNGDADGVFISCTGLRTIDIIQSLENDIEKPVISSNSAMFAMLMKGLGIHEKIEGYGNLISTLDSTP